MKFNSILSVIALFIATGEASRFTNPEQIENENPIQFNTPQPGRVQNPLYKRDIIFPEFPRPFPRFPFPRRNPGPFPKPNPGSIARPSPGSLTRPSVVSKVKSKRFLNFIKENLA